ncbi:MAG: hypothetical protein R3C02_13570 [Planctomycetaceae bacterium]
MTDSADGYVIADAIRVEATTDLSLPPGTIIDNGDGGFGTTAGFSPSLFGNGHEAICSMLRPVAGSSVATWTFSGLTAGDYRVSATWFRASQPGHGHRIVIRDGISGRILTTVMVDQTLAPNDFTTFGSYWEDLLRRGHDYRH